MGIKLTQTASLQSVAVKPQSSGGSAYLKTDAKFLQGLSAYEIAVRQGYTGTEAEWIAWLEGDRTEGITNTTILKLWNRS